VNPFYLCTLRVGGEVDVEMNLPEAPHLTEYVEATPCYQLLLTQTARRVKAYQDALERGEDLAYQDALERGEDLPDEDPDAEIKIPASELEAIILLLARCTQSIPGIERKYFRGWWARRQGSDIIQCMWLYAAQYMLHHKPELAASMSDEDAREEFEDPEPI
jgi:hypothetical protein